MKMSDIKKKMDELKKAQEEKARELEELNQQIEQMKDKEMAEQGKMLMGLFPNFEDFMKEYLGTTKQEQAKLPEFIAQAIESWTEAVAKERMEKSEARRQKKLGQIPKAAPAEPETPSDTEFPSANESIETAAENNLAEAMNPPEDDTPDNRFYPRGDME